VTEGWKLKGTNAQRLEANWYAPKFI